MTQVRQVPSPRRPFARPLVARTRDESHRASTPLELFFDLVIVVAVARAAAGLHHDIAEAHVASGVLGYAMVFFGIWWAWMNFTWFASAYDNDDALYRILVFVQLVGALVFAAGAADMAHGDRTTGTIGYVVMRLAVVAQWLRAARGDPPRRSAHYRYVLGVLLAQSLWVASLWLSRDWVVPSFFALVALELAVPAWAERAAATPWHPEHIAERYGLFTIIALGESILAASLALEAADTEGALRTLAPIVVGGLLIVLSSWWLYFERPAAESLTSMRRAFLWGYGHYVVFASIAAVGAGIALAIDHALGRTHTTDVVVGAAVAIPVALFLATLWSLDCCGGRSGRARTVGAVAIAAILAAPLTPEPVLMTGAVTALLVVVEGVRSRLRSSSR